MAKTTKRDLTHKEWQRVRMWRAGIANTKVAEQSGLSKVMIGDYFAKALMKHDAVISYAIELLLSERVNPENMGGGE
jgi:DNA-binding NarL/FixJ family response regulator